MKIVIFSNAQEFTQLADAIRGFGSAFADAHIHHLEDYDAYRRALVDERYDLAIVSVDGAWGMEVCIGTRKIHPHIPLLWFSNDHDFGPQSYRLDCTYFACKPVSQERLSRAFLRLQEQMAYTDWRKLG